MKSLSKVLTKAVGPKTLALRASSPKLFFVAGVAGMVTSTVLACRATLKLEETLDATEDQGPVKVGFAVAKVYAPAAIVGAASVAMLTQSHSILVKRNAALSAAYTALEQGFHEYRARVVEKYGKEEDDRLRYGFEVEEVKKGQKITKVDRVNPETGASIYARIFDEYNPNWSKDPEINKIFLRAQQNYFNDLLHARGHLFLNEVYESLGFEHSEAGAVVGWILDEDGDNFVDLGIFGSRDSDQLREFVNGRESSVLLDFNVDGLIYNKIGKKPLGELRWQGGRWFRV